MFRENMSDDTKQFFREEMEKRLARSLEERKISGVKIKVYEENGSLRVELSGKEIAVSEAQIALRMYRPFLVTKLEPDEK